MLSSRPKSWRDPFSTISPIIHPSIPSAMHTIHIYQIPMKARWCSRPWNKDVRETQGSSLSRFFTLQAGITEANNPLQIIWPVYSSLAQACPTLSLKSSILEDLSILKDQDTGSPWAQKEWREEMPWLHPVEDMAHSQMSQVAHQRKQHSWKPQMVGGLRERGRISRDHQGRLCILLEESHFLRKVKETLQESKQGSWTEDKLRKIALAVLCRE